MNKLYGYISAAILAAMILFLSGCGTPVEFIGDYATGSMTAREAFNMGRLDATVEQSKEPVIDFKMSHSAAKALADLEPEYDAEGNPIPAFQFTYTPRMELPGYVEAPYWRLLPTGDGLISGILGGAAIWTGYENNKRNSEQNFQLQMRSQDSQDAFVEQFFSVYPVPAPPSSP